MFSQVMETVEPWYVSKEVYPTKVLLLSCTVKPVLNSHSKIDKTEVLKINASLIKSSLMKVESIAECSLGAFCNIFDLH